MKTVLALLLAAAVAPAQVGALPGTTAPPRAKPGAPPAAARARAPAPAAAHGSPSYRDLKFPPLRGIQPPNAATFTLPNGMKLYLVEDHDLPLFGGVALVRTGTVMDPPERVGLAQLAAITMRTGGTSVKTGEQVDTVLDNIASTMESAVSEDVGSLSFGGMQENSAALLALFKEILTQPAFRQDKLDLAKGQLRNTIAHRNDSARLIVRRELGSLVYGKDSPYGWRQEYATVGRVSRSDLRAFHQRYFFPANVTLGIWGDFDTAGMKSSIEKLFADWTVQQSPVPEFVKAKNAPTPGLFLIEKRDTQQSFLAMGHLAGLRSDKDAAALEVLAVILGGGPQGRIASRLRNALHVNTDIAAAWNAGFTHPGLFEISGATSSVSTIDTIKAIQDEIGRIRTVEVSEGECRGAREAVIARLVFADDSAAKLFARQLTLEYYGYPRDYLAQYQKALQAVTRADLLRAAQQYLDPANLTVVVAANPNMLTTPLEKLGPVTKLDVTIPDAKSEPVESSDASLKEGRRILLEAQAAAGGAENLAAVKDYTMLIEYHMDPSAPNSGGARVVQTDRWVAPTTFRQDSTLPTGRVNVYTDGNVGWISNSQRWGALAGTPRSQVFGDLFRVYFRLLLSERIEGRTVNALDDSTVQIADATGQMVSVEFDEQTHLLKRVSFDAPQAAGTPVYSEEVYEDFRDVGGVKVPFKIIASQGGRKFSEAVVKDYKINTGLKPLDLARRPQ